nr:hypothetical protein [Tanacetum cinerariifolium]
MVYVRVVSNSFDCPPDSYHPPHPTYATYSGDTCGNDSQFSYDCPPQFQLNYEPEPGCIQNYNSYPHDSPSIPQQYPCCEDCGVTHEPYQCLDQIQPPQFPVIHPPPQETSIEILHDQENTINSVQTFLRKFNRYSFFETPKLLLLAWDRVFEIKDAFGNKQYKPKDIQELFRKLLNDLQTIHEELVEYINTPGWNRPAFYKNDDDDDVDYTITITPVLSTEEPDNSLSMGDEHLDTISATESDEVINSCIEDLVPIPSDFEGIPDTMCDVHLVNNPTPLEARDHFEIVINSNNDYSSSNDDSLYNENIEYIKALKDNPTSSSELLTKSSSISAKSFLEETNTFHNSLPELENFCFDLEEISSGSTTTHFDISLPDYEAFYFYDDYIEEIVFPPTDRSDFTHEEFADELAHIISPPEYDCFYFRNLPDP